MHAALVARRGVQLAVLFGSFASGKSGPDSDIDLAVHAPGVPLDELAASLTEALGATVDLVSIYDASIPLLEALIADGIVVFEASEGDGALWRSRTLAQLETDRPWYRRMRDSWIAQVAERGFNSGQ